MQDLVEGELVLTRPAGHDSANLPAMPAQEQTRGFVVTVARGVREEAQQVFVVGRGMFHRVERTSVSVMLKERSGQRARRVNDDTGSHARLVGGEFHHQAVHVLEFLQCGPASVPSPPIGAWGKPDCERLREVFIRMALRIPAAQVLHVLLAGRVGPV